MTNGLVIVGLVIPLVLSLLGWAYQLGRSDARTSRNEKDIERMNSALAQADKDLRTEIRESFNKVFGKLDALPCHNPGWKKDGC